MLRYEILMLSIPEITADESKKIESDIDYIIDQSKGAVISYERWGKYKLAYPIDHHEYGIYFLARFEVKQENMKKLLDSISQYFAVKQTELIMRHIIMKLSSKNSLEYKKPESLEDIPVSDIDNFLKENKMTGFLDNSEIVQEENKD